MASASACVKTLAVKGGTVSGAETPVAHSGVRERHGARAAHRHSVHAASVHAHSTHSHATHAARAHAAETTAASETPATSAAKMAAGIREIRQAQHGSQGAGRQSYREMLQFQLHPPPSAYLKRHGLVI
jgi:hypothetical protein